MSSRCLLSRSVSPCSWHSGRAIARCQRGPLGADIVKYRAPKQGDILDIHPIKRLQPTSKSIGYHLLSSTAPLKAAYILDANPIKRLLPKANPIRYHFLSSTAPSNTTPMLDTCRAYSPQAARLQHTCQVICLKSELDT